MEIILVRHGQTDWNLQGRCQGSTDLELNSSGVEQAETLALGLRQEKIHGIYSSHLKRALQTADRIRQYHRIEVVADEDLRELDHGYLEGLTFVDVREKYPEFIGRWRREPALLTVPGGESLADVDGRIWQAMQRIARRHLSETVVVVTHNFPILALLCRITETPLNQYRAFHVEPGGLKRIGYEQDRGWRVLSADDNGRARDSREDPLKSPPPAAGTVSRPPGGSVR
jgi:broad specificity phosphatase PhoE